MAVENPTHISDLNPLWPADDETPQQGDDHLRLIKQVLIDDLGSLEGSLTLTAEQINSLVDGVAACVEKAGDTMSGDLVMTDYKGVTFALAEDSDIFGRVVGRDDRVVIEILDTDGTTVLASIIFAADGTTFDQPVYVPLATDSGGALNWENRQEILLVEDRQAQGVGGGATSSATWNKRPINTAVYNGIVGASLDTDDITLPAGLYEVDITVPSYASDHYSCRLVNADGLANLLIGTSEKADEDPTGTTQTHCFIKGVITLAVETTMYVEHYTVYAHPEGMGIAGNQHTEGNVFLQGRFSRL